MMKPSTVLVLSGVALVAAACTNRSSTSTSSATTTSTATNRLGPATASATADPSKRTFDVRHEWSIKVPVGSKEVHAWLPMPNSDPAQAVYDSKIDTAAQHELVKDSNGNPYLHVTASNPTSETIGVVHTFKVTRAEVRVDADPARTRPLSAAETAEHAAALAPFANVEHNDKIRELSARIVGTETNPVANARRIYDWVLANIDYWVKEPKTRKASPVGSAEYCLTTSTGNCTDFHSLWMALAQTAGIPTRIVYGSMFKPDLDGVDKDASYHCWLEFFAPNIGWVPLDVAIADIFDGTYPVNDDNSTLIKLTTASSYKGPDKHLVGYYFGNLEPRRVTFNEGRDLQMTPRQSGGAVNANPKGYVEIDGKVVTDWTRKLTYREIKSG